MLTNICLQKKKILYFVFDEKGFPKKKKKKKIQTYCVLYTQYLNMYK